MTVTQRMESQRGQIGKEIRHDLDKNGNPWANFSLAVDRNRQDQQGNWHKEGTDWYQVSVFGAQAANVAESLRPGAPVVVTGRLETEHRLGEDDNGQPVVQVRNNVIADVVAPDLRRTAVILPDKPETAGPSVSGTGPQATAEATAAPTQGQVAQQPGQQAYQQAQAQQPQQGQAAAPAGGAGWPQVAQPGSGQGTTFA